MRCRYNSVLSLAIDAYHGEFYALDLNRGDGRVANKGVVFVEPCLAPMTLPAKWHVHIVPANHVLYLIAGCAEREAGALFAKLADSGQLLDFLALRYKFQDCWEDSSLEGSLQ